MIAVIWKMLIVAEKWFRRLHAPELWEKKVTSKNISGALDGAVATSVVTADAIVRIRSQLLVPPAPPDLIKSRTFELRIRLEV